MRAKKTIFLTGAFLVLFLASGAARAFALPLPLSVGGGVNIGTESLVLEWPDGSLSDPIVWDAPNRINVRQNSIGASVFFDAHFVMLGVDFLQGNFDVGGTMMGPTLPDVFAGTWSATMINFNLIGKFPIPLFNMQNVRVFPMLGVGYQFANVVEDLDGGLFDRGFNNFRILFGLGADFDFNSRVFLRLSVLPYYHMTRNVSLSLVDPANSPSDTTFVAHGGFGANASLAIGFRLGNNPQPMPRPRGDQQAEPQPQVAAAPEPQSPPPQQQADEEQESA